MTKTTKYPNLTAEYEATKYHIDTIAEWANVSVRTLYGVMYAGEPLQFKEMYAIYNHLWGTKSFEYLCAPKLALVNPFSNRGRYQAHLLQVALGNYYNTFGACYQIQDVTMREGLESANSVAYDLEHGRHVTYASYRQALFNVLMLTAVARKRSRPSR